ncbi:MAG: 5,10-methylenetetrahydromethanopterin reductase [Acidimicrobiia bacterium]|nr:MAG: 5,10-methylenetetrahydromethanopterin reductase [Acidimicrobiia bacterium]
MQISCGFPPSPGHVEHVVEAERLGYARAWMFDSPALYGDVWTILGIAALRTDRIGLGPAVLVPNLRHPLAQASAIATLEQLAPGRAAAAIGTGFTGRMAMGQRPLTWEHTRRYVEQVRALLRGERVEVDGAIVQMLHAEPFAPPRPVATPLVVAANGPKGTAVARELGDGIMTIGGTDPTFDWCAVLVFGTVLDDGEDAGSPRAIEAAGPGVTVVYHGVYENDPAAVDALPGGARWRAAIESLPERERHLAVHEDHMHRVTERDRALVTGDLLRSFTWTGTRDELRGRLEALEAAGATEVLYVPMGPDLPRELRAFAEMAGIA